MQEESLPQPKSSRIVPHSEDEISRADHGSTVEAAPLNPQRATHAFYRPFVPDDLDETNMPAPLRGSVSYHSVAELTHAQMPKYSTVESPKGTNAERMYKRPGFDNVPSY